MGREVSQFDVYALHVGDHKYRYVGVTTLGAEKRLGGHKRKSRNPEKNRAAVYSWIRKYYDDVTFEVLETVELKEELYPAEIKWIAKMREEGYDLLNMVEGGRGSIGLKFTEERRAKQGKWFVGKKLTPEHVEKSRIARTGAKRSDEAKAKMRAAKLGKAQSPEHAEKSRKQLEENRNDPAVRAKLSEAGLKRYQDPEERAKAARKGRKCIDCDLVSTNMGMGRHLKYSGHSGYEEIVDD
jgi:hypothetical protein